jgi:Sugar (and other) transporter
VKTLLSRKITLIHFTGILGGAGHYAGPKGVNGIPEASTAVHGAASKALIACSYLFVASFAPTWGPVSWIYPPELYPLRVRGKAVALSTSANWAMNFALGYFVRFLFPSQLTTLTFIPAQVPPAFVNIQWRTYIIFGVFCVSMFVHVYFCFPETAGKTLEEVKDIFEDPNGIKYVGTPAWKTRVDRKRTHKVERHGSVDEEDGYVQKGRMDRVGSNESGTQVGDETVERISGEKPL